MVRQLEDLSIDFHVFFSQGNSQKHEYICISSLLCLAQAYPLVRQYPQEQEPAEAANQLYGMWKNLPYNSSEICKEMNARNLEKKSKKST